MKPYVFNLKPRFEEVCKLAAMSVRPIATEVFVNHLDAYDNGWSPVSITQIPVLVKDGEPYLPSGDFTENVAESLCYIRITVIPSVDVKRGQIWLGTT